MGVYRSTDAVNWERQDLILDLPGSDPMDRQIGRHADVVTQGDWAAIVYHTHPHWSAPHTAEARSFSDRRSTIHYARLTVVDDKLVCQRDVGPLRLEGKWTDTIPASAAE
jgi:hypothetical protein